MSRYQQLFSTYLFLLLIHVHLVCFAQIRDVSCSSVHSRAYCSNSGSILFNGNNFANVPKQYRLSNDPPITFNRNLNSKTQLSGKIYYDTKTVPDGPYVIHSKLSKNKDLDWSGTIMLGNFFGQFPKLWCSNSFPPTDAYVTGQSSNEIYKGLTFNISGKFNMSKEYEVLFYSSDVYTQRLNVPICLSLIKSEINLLCELSKIPFMKPTYRFIVKENNTNNYLKMKNILAPLNPIESPSPPEPYPETLPIITNASGTCVADSSKCVDGATMTFIGEAFLENAPTNYYVRINGIEEAQCIAELTTNNSLTCVLSGIGNQNGGFTMDIQIRGEDGEWSVNSAKAGTLMLGQRDGSAGWTLDYIEPTHDTTGHTSFLRKIIRFFVTLFEIFVFFVVVVGLLLWLRSWYVSRSTWSTSPEQFYNTHIDEVNLTADSVDVKSQFANNNNNNNNINNIKTIAP